jgi:HNH endonuclease.
MCDLDIDKSKELEAFDYWGFDKPKSVGIQESQELLKFGMKKCRKCGEVKGLEEFYNCEKSRDGKYGACKKCCSNWHKEHCQIPEVKVRIKVYNKAYGKEHRQDPEVKARNKAYDKEQKQRPEVKTRAKIRAQSPEAKARAKKADEKHRQKPEAKAKKSTYNKEHGQIPEVKARVNEQRKKRNKERLANDENYKIACYLRSRMGKAIKGGPKVGSAVDDLTCSIDEFKVKMARFFEPGMSWANRGNGPGKWHLDHIIPLSAFDLTNEEQFKSAAHYSNYQPLWSEENLSKGDNY